MRSEEEIKERIEELEKREYGGEGYLDEGEQAELNILRWVLGEQENYYW